MYYPSRRPLSLLALVSLLCGLWTPCIASEPTDQEVQKALSNLTVPNGRPRPTLEEFRTYRVMDSQGVMRPGTVKEFLSFYQYQHLPEDLASRYYPSVFEQLNTPEDLVLFFLLRSDSTVISHKAVRVRVPDAEPLYKTLAQQFPQANITQRTSQGFQCFPPIPGKRAKFCAGYAIQS